PTETIPPPTSCPPPSGWVAITVQPGEDLLTLAARYKITREQLLAANCLFSNDLPTGSILYVPPVPTNTPVPCGPPAGWIRYTVQPGNTLYSLSQAYGVSLSQLQFANCMPANQYNLVTGQTLWVPNVVTRTPRATATPTLTPVIIIFPTLTGTIPATSTTIAPPTSTNIPTSTDVPTGTPTGTATGTASPPPTATPPATATITAFPTQTPNP
ncbi:MAG: LysM peptidoglycan-binding domain-containing protein, partial [Chloroflexi bacterium]|nr:LysM peptidoglycan-binding domain-containing protein [Chloroflexota bacterium]